MTAHNINILVIGCGRIGRMHIDNLLCAFPNVNIKKIVDSQLDPAWARQRNITLLKKEDLEMALNDDAIHAVLIASSSFEHVKLICKAAQAGKHIFCEKPISFDEKKLQHANNICNENNVKLQVGLNRRFDPDFIRVKQCVETGQIGDIHIIKITNRDPKRPDLDFIPRSGGLFLDFSVHDFDMLRFISNSEITEVFASGANLVDPEIGRLGDIDTCIISVKLANGALCVIDASREAQYGYDQRLEVFGSKGNILARNTQPSCTRLSTTQGVNSEKPYYSFVERYQTAYCNQFAAFFDAIINDTETAVSASDMKKAIIAARCAKKSFETNTPISTKGE